MGRARPDARQRAAPFLWFIMPKPCFKCGRLTRNVSQCDVCLGAPGRRRGTAAQRGYDRDWQILSRLARSRSPVCENCGRRDDLTADHIVPLARGGTNTIENVRVLCRSCNSARRDR